ncbi:putative phage P2 GpU family protein [Escherichia coli]|uniref:Putative phage P2 GpU family protein n=1 Tax=Escherichia coli TaxID=562 RepID=A0A377B712_ECOLX|nr:putative phage P2 GpU family protein [Escherichia coli]
MALKALWAWITPTHARIEGKPGVQFIGDKLDMLALEFSLHSQFCQPTTELNRLREAMLAPKQWRWCLATVIIAAGL